MEMQPQLSRFEFELVVTMVYLINLDSWNQFMCSKTECWQEHSKWVEFRWCLRQPAVNGCAHGRRQVHVGTATPSLGSWVAGGDASLGSSDQLLQQQRDSRMENMCEVMVAGNKDETEMNSACCFDIPRQILVFF